MTNVALVRLRIALLAALVVVLPTPAHARQVDGFSITPPGASKTFDAIPGTTVLYSFVPPTYEDCRDDVPLMTPSCDFIPVHIDAGRLNGHTTTLTLDWPNPVANNLDVVLWNPEIRENYCDPLDVLDRFCGSEGRSIGTFGPSEMVFYDLPPGDYVLTVWNTSGRNAGYTVTGEIELL